MDTNTGMLNNSQHYYVQDKYFAVRKKDVYLKKNKNLAQ